MAQQILFIHGGECFDSHEEYMNFLRTKEVSPDDLRGKKRWRDHLQDDLGDDYEIFLPVMPNGWNAKYIEWKIWFEKFFPFLREEIILLGHSLGGLFIAKFLAENILPVKIKTTIILAAPFSEGDFALPESLEKFEKQVGKIYLYQSKDDPIVPFVDMEKYAAKLPSAEKVIFEDKEHFILQEFPEMVEKLRSL